MYAQRYAAVRQSRFYVSHIEKALEKLLIEYEKI